MSEDQHLEQCYNDLNGHLKFFDRNGKIKAFNELADIEKEALRQSHIFAHYKLGVAFQELLNSFFELPPFKWLIKK
jgi:hypothetical protein